MSKSLRKARRNVAAASLAAGLAVLIGCAPGWGFDTTFPLWGVSPFQTLAPGIDADAAGSNTTDSGFFSGGSTSATSDPCQESLNRKFVRISMRNHAEDFIHYFLVLVAFENGEIYPDGAACAEDADLYTDFGYTRVNEGAAASFGNYCVTGPAFVYFHRAGRFRGTGANTLASAIAPAAGTNPTFDSFFTSSGAQVPAPNIIMFHNPGTGDGAQLSTRRYPDACDQNIVTPVLDDCNLDAWYYVDQDDQFAGSNALGSGSGRRVPTEIQGTSCECGALAEGGAAGSVLAEPGVRSADVPCNAFVRGGRIEYAFVRDDTTPPYPQLLWRVTDNSGGQVHNFDSRSGLR
jgi:hypothetical protein